MKNFWKYFTITILLLLGLCCVGVLYMFFVGAPLFKIKYITNNKEYISKSYKLGEGGVNVDTVNLTSYNFDVMVRETENDAISLKIHNGAFGFVLVANSELSFSEEYVLGNLNFNVVEPHGFTARGNSQITLFIPKNSQLNLVLNNNKASTTIAAPTVEIKNLSYTTKSGKFNFNSGKVSGNLELELGRATLAIANEVDMSANKVNLSMTSGCLNCANKDFGSINLIKSTSGVVRAKSCTSLVGKNENAGGSVTIGSVENANFVGGDTNVKINKLNFGTIDIKKTGRVEIDTIEGSSRINTNSGKISIGKANSYELFVNSVSGNITIGNSFGNVNAVTESGDISVSFDNSANSFDAEQKARRLFATTDSGDITAYGVENTEIKIKDDGSVSLFMNNVIEANNLIDAGKGSVYLQIREEGKQTAPNGVAHYKLYWETSSGAVSVNLSNTHELATEGVHDKQAPTDGIYINDDQHSTTNSFVVKSSSGNIKIRDSITQNY